MKELPEDSKDWPNDPFELLDLQRSDDARTAKRAYFKLIRKYKPDRFPAEFQKIRAAYESVERRLGGQGQRGKDPYDFSQAQSEARPTVVSSNGFETDQNEEGEENEEDKSEEVEKVEKDEEVEKVEEDRVVAQDEEDNPSLVRSKKIPKTLSSTLQKTDPLEMFFTTLSSKSLEEAVSHLKDVDPSQGSGNAAKSSLIKYFAARFFPDSLGDSHAEPANDEVDLGYSKGDLKRIAWLIDALGSQGTSSTAMAQLRVEFDQNYRLANCESVNRFLSKATDVDSLVQVYHLRWEAIGHYQPRTVVHDVKSNQHLGLDYGRKREAWMSLLTESMNYTVWYDDPACVDHTKASWQEIAENHQTWDADSVELLKLTGRQWGWMNCADNDWLFVTPWARNSLPETLRARWMPVAQAVAAWPVAALKVLDDRFQHYALAMSLFEEGLQGLLELEVGSTAAEPSQEEVRALVAGYFLEIATADYATNRIPMMEFCILNQISLRSFAAAADSFVDRENAESWFDLVQRDCPMKCVINACHSTNH